MNPNLLIDHFHTPLSFCNHVCFLTVCVFQFYKIVHWYQFLLLKYFTYYDCSSSRLSLKMALFFHSWIIFHSIHMWFLYSFICPCIFSLLPCLSCCKCCCSACLCAVLFSCYFYLENPDSPHETLSPLSPPSAPDTHHPALCVYGADCSRCLVWVYTNSICSSMSALCLWA